MLTFEYTPKELVDKFLNHIQDDCQVHFSTHRLDRFSGESFKEKEASFLFEVDMQMLKIYGERQASINCVQMDGLTYGLKLLLESIQYWADIEHIITQEQCTTTKSYAIKYFMKEALSLPKKIFSDLEYEIPGSDMMFMIYEFVFHSPVHTEQYSFDGIDMRRTAFSRIELAAYNKRQNYLSSVDNAEYYLLDAIENFHNGLEYISDISYINKEVEYRTQFINSFYFNMEHFLGSVLKAKGVDTSKVSKKQQYLNEVQKVLSICDALSLSAVTSSIIERCRESSPVLKSIVLQKVVLNKNAVELFLRLVNMRNSLHSNGVSNRAELPLKIGQIDFQEVKQGKANNAMGMLQITAITLIMIYVMERIVEKTTDIALIEDSYVKGKKEFMNI